MKKYIGSRLKIKSKQSNIWIIVLHETKLWISEKNSKIKLLKKKLKTLKKRNICNRISPAIGRIKKNIVTKKCF